MSYGSDTGVTIDGKLFDSIYTANLGEQVGRELDRRQAKEVRAAAQLQASQVRAAQLATDEANAEQAASHAAAVWDELLPADRAFSYSSAGARQMSRTTGRSFGLEDVQLNGR